MAFSFVALASILSDSPEAVEKVHQLMASPEVKELERIISEHFSYTVEEDSEVTLEKILAAPPAAAPPAAPPAADTPPPGTGGSFPE